MFMLCVGDNHPVRTNINPVYPDNIPQSMKGRKNVTPCEQDGTIRQHYSKIIDKSFFHEDDFPFNQTGFKSNLYYSHMDMRPMKPGRHKKHQVYIEQGTQSEETGDIVSGVKGIGIMFVPGKSSSYATFEDISWPVFHAMKNTTNNLIECMKGERFSKKDTVYAIQENTIFWEQNTQPSFILSAHKKNLIDAYTNCIVIPTGCRDKNVITNPMLQTGHLSGSQRIVFMTTILPSLLALVNYTSHYRVFHSMYADDINRLMSPQISLDDIPRLQFRIRELVSLHEGLYPAGEFHVFHNNTVCNTI